MGLIQNFFNLSTFTKRTLNSIFDLNYMEFYKWLEKHKRQQFEWPEKCPLTTFVNESYYGNYHIMDKKIHCNVDKKHYIVYLPTWGSEYLKLIDNEMQKLVNIDKQKKDYEKKAVYKKYHIHGKHAFELLEKISHIRNKIV